MPGKRKRQLPEPPPKRRKKSISAVPEITFDFGAREDYLTGFHKRKLQRIKHAKEEAAKKEREDKVVARKLLREGRKVDLENHVEAINSMLRKADGADGTSDSDEDEPAGEEWSGLHEGIDVDHEAEYMDEDRHTTVTIEAVDVTRDGLRKVVYNGAESSDKDEVTVTESGVEATKGVAVQANGKSKRVWTKERPGGAKKKKKKFKYETKAERRVTRYKERSGNKAKAKARKE